MTFRHWFFKQTDKTAEIFVCVLCGAAVFDKKRHDKYHQSLEKR